LCEDSENGKKYAIKKIPEINKEIIERQFKILEKIGSNHNCSGLVQIYVCFEEDEKYYIVMEYCGEKSLRNYIEKDKNLMDEDVFYLILILNI
jgi:serine/threonine protein kinase